MAKKNSTKTATKEAISASEPRHNTYGQWQGVNFKDAAPGWLPLDNGPNESDLASTFLMVQNNVDTTGTLTLEARHDTQHIADCPAWFPDKYPNDDYQFNGVSCLIGDRLFAAFTRNSRGLSDEQGAGLMYYRLDSFNGDWSDNDQCKEAWHRVHLLNGNGSGVWKDQDIDLEVTYIGYYQDTLIVFTNQNVMFTGNFDKNGDIESVSSAMHIDAPSVPPVFEVREDLKEGDVSRISITYIYTNKFGFTENHPGSWATITTDCSPVEWSAAKYLNISGTYPLNKGVTGVDLYCRIDENSDAIFIGHVTISEDDTSGKWEYNWLGAMADTSVWTNVSLTIPTENTTEGVNAQYMRNHDGRLYFWGGEQKYRLWIGGNPGNELSVARGVGGGFVDIDPGTGTYVNGTAKFKTYNGASIVTIMCGNPNTGMVKRFNLLETNVTVTNEISSKGYMTEEVANVIGCNSPYGFGVFADGLYSINRYGLGLTTQAMESQNQLRVQYVSDPIAPIFTDRISNRLNNCRMVCINEIIYIVLATDTKGDDYRLDRVILCYDINSKAWYTYTYEGPESEEILHVISIDSEDHIEGLGIITPHHIHMIPTTMGMNATKPTFETIIESGEIGLRNYRDIWIHLCQLEFKFDYIIGDLDIDIEGWDYYGRRYHSHKEIRVDRLRRMWTEWLRIDKKVETFRIRIKGKAHFRLTHIISKTYQQSDKIGLVYGWDSSMEYYSRHGGDETEHHYIDDYNNLRLAIVP